MVVSGKPPPEQQWAPGKQNQTAELHFGSSYPTMLLVLLLFILRGNFIDRTPIFTENTTVKCEDSNFTKH